MSATAVEPSDPSCSHLRRQSPDVHATHQTFEIGRAGAQPHRDNDEHSAHGGAGSAVRFKSLTYVANTALKSGIALRIGQESPKVLSRLLGY
jgi:hypothetical protein